MVNFFHNLKCYFIVTALFFSMRVIPSDSQLDLSSNKNVYYAKALIVDQESQKRMVILTDELNARRNDSQGYYELGGLITQKSLLQKYEAMCRVEIIEAEYWENQVLSICNQELSIVDQALSTTSNSQNNSSQAAKSH